MSINASHDQNHVPTLLGVSSSDGATPITIYANPITHRLLVDSAGGGSGITSINADTTANQFLVVGTAGTDFAIVDDGVGTHTFNLPSASATARGVVTTGTQTFAGTKTFSAVIATTFNGVGLTGSSTPSLAVTGTSSISGSNTGDQNLFSQIVVSGQTTVTANTTTTSLTMVAGTNVTLTTDNTAKSVTINASGGGGGGSNGFAWFIS